MIGVAAYFDGTAFKGVTNTAEIVMQFIFVRWLYQRLTVLGAENNMDTVFSDFRKIIDAFISQDNLLDRCRTFNPNN